MAGADDARPAARFPAAGCAVRARAGAPGRRPVREGLLGHVPTSFARSLPGTLPGAGARGDHGPCARPARWAARGGAGRRGRADTEEGPRHPSGRSRLTGGESEAPFSTGCPGPSRVQPPARSGGSVRVRSRRTALVEAGTLPTTRVIPVPVVLR
ncbi:hypothetical protein GCM10009736_33840 [Actinomadura bangladeshensis]